MEKKKPFILDIDIDNLKLDLHNPRLPKSKQGKDEKSVIEYLLLEAATEELMTAIAENDFFRGELYLSLKILMKKGSILSWRETED